MPFLLLVCLSFNPAWGAEWAAPAAGRADVHPLVWRLLDESDRPLKVWVFFADKGQRSEEELRAALERTRRTMNARALRRRELRRTAPDLVDQRDLPLDEAYVRGVADTGAQVVVRSRWLNAVSAFATAEQVRALAQLPFVRSVEPVRRGRRQTEVPIESIVPVPVGERRILGASHGLSEAQLAQIGITEMHDAGYTGAGIIIGILDTGFVRTHDAFNYPEHPVDVIAEYDFINDDPNAAIDEGDASGQHFHGTLILGVIGAYLPGDLLGGAYDASFVLAKTEDTTGEYPAEEDYYAAGLEFIEAEGADVATSSLGYIDWYTWFDLDGLTAVTSIAVNAATANGLACCTAAGNGGSDNDLPSLMAPGDAFEVITCGAVDEDGAMAGFSSNGPSADGRVKPEVVARGVATASIDPNNDAEFITASGTSLSTPLVASAVALLIQAHPDWSIAQIRTALFTTADLYEALGITDPDFLRGYGLIDVFAASQFEFCDADLDGDGSVGAADLAVVLGNWGPNPGHPADFNDDGVVNAADLAIVLGNWGPC